MVDGDGGELVEDIKAVFDFSKHDVGTIQMRGRTKEDRERRNGSTNIAGGMGHREPTAKVLEVVMFEEYWTHEGFLPVREEPVAILSHRRSGFSGGGGGDSGGGGASGGF